MSTAPGAAKPLDAVVDALRAAGTRQADGYSEGFGAVERDGERLAYWTARPGGAVRHGVVWVPSFLSYLSLERDEVTCLRAAARSGLASICLHPPGSWESSGAADGCSLTERVEVALEAAQLLRDRDGVEAVCFFGSRLGACVAALAAGATLGSSLVMWDPVFDIERYWERLRRVSRLGAINQRSGRFQDPIMELKEQGWTTVGGVRISRERAREIDAIPGLLRDLRIDGPILWAGSEGSLRENRGLVGKLSAEIQLVDLGRRRNDGVFAGAELAVDPTLEWMERHLAS